MNDLNGHAVPVGATPVPPAKTPFVLSDGSRFELDLVATSRQLRRLSKQFENAEDGEHLDAFVAWVKTQTGVSLSDSQADWLWQYVLVRREEAGQVFRDTLQSLSSTGSTPSNSQTTSSPA